MSETATGLGRKDSEIIHYYRFRNISVKLVRRGDKYLIITRKYILHFIRMIDSCEFKNYYDAEDMYLGLKSDLQFYARAF